MMQKTNTLSRNDRSRWLDKLGIGIAGLCAVHCIATIVLVSRHGIPHTARIQTGQAHLQLTGFNHGVDHQLVDITLVGGFLTA